VSVTIRRCRGTHSLIVNSGLVIKTEKYIKKYLWFETRCVLASKWRATDVVLVAVPRHRGTRSLNVNS
jgi:hypothetical protein